MVDDGDIVQLIRPTPSNFSVISHTGTFNSSSITSLSSHFTFQIGNGVALLIIPAQSPSKLAKNMSLELINANRFLGTEFYANSCTISYSTVSNISKYSNVLKNGVNLSAWVDYGAISKRLDVKLSKVGDHKPVEPLISYGIDLEEIFKGEEVLVALASSNATDHEQLTSAYEWNMWSSYDRDSRKALTGEEYFFGESENEKNEKITTWRIEIEENVSEWNQLVLEIKPKQYSDVFSVIVFATGCAALTGAVSLIHHIADK
ncbi:hypothetical protein QVD17_35924 [Tagetes erecta]|uniref:Legume lectin domain-containing protein n=1 Tax=Tagetes erecta TaxID=13708 RepID=A0AAD8NIM6_TARER|nr:hypothetical protein QVD17_35924 [Tagetes erecta]